MATPISLEVIEDPSPEQIDVLVQGVRQHGRDSKDIPDKKIRAIFAKENDKIVGGIVCIVYLGALQLEKLWVDKENRKKGIASSLLDAAEAHGKMHNCRFATLTTADWEAIDFYLKNDYIIEFKRDGYDQNSVLYYLKKDFL